MKGLVGLMTLMWLMVLAVAAFLVAFVGPIENLFGSKADRLTISAIQAAIAIGAVLALISGLSLIKRLYAQRILRT